MVKVHGLYKIQVGAYAVKANADKTLAQLKAKGFDAFITTKSGTSVGSSTPDPSKTVKVGCKVRVKDGAKTCTGGKLADVVYNTAYDVIQVSGDRVVIGIGKSVTAAVHKDDLTVV